MQSKLIEVFNDISFEQYHLADGLSSTGISHLLECPYKYRRYRDEMQSAEKSKTNKNFTNGSCVHTLVLEPEKFEERFFVVNKGQSRTEKLLKEIKDSKGDVEILTYNDFVEAKSQADSLLEHALAKEIKDKKGMIEQSIFYTGFDTVLKTRPDFYNDTFCLDIKTTRSANEYDFSRAIAEYGYHRQAALALNGLEAVTGKQYQHFIFLCVEKEWPYCTASYVISRDDESGKRYDAIAHGWRDIEKAVEIYKNCVKRNKWPSYSDKITEINLPYWMQGAA